MENLYLIKNISPWMIDELLVFSKRTKFKIVFIRKPGEFYSKKLEELQRAGIEIVISPFKFNFNPGKVFFCLKFILQNISSFFSGYSFVISVKSIWWFLKLDEIHFKNPVSIHAQFATQPSIMALILKKYYGDASIKYFFTFHAYDIFFNNKWFVKLVNNSQRSFSISQYNINYVLKHYKGIDSSKVELNRLGAFSNELPSFIENGSEIFNLGFISWFVEKKGIRYLLEAMKIIALENNCIKLTLAGDGPLRAEIENFILTNNLTGVVDYIGKVDFNGKINFFSGLDALVMPSISLPDDMEGIPVVLMEAISFGLPVIATNISGIPEICINDYNGLLVPEKDVQALVDAIIQMSMNKIARTRFSKNSIKLFGDYNIEVNSLQKLEKLNWI